MSFLSHDERNVNRIINVSIDHATDTNLDCLDELVNYARQIAATMPAPYTLFVSGGIDSQAMAYVWKLSGVKFEAVHVNYEGFNMHDRDEIVHFCETQDIPLRIVDFDLIHFLENDLDKYATKYECASPQLCTHMAFSELVPNGTKVFSGNLAMENLALDNTIFGLYRYAMLSGHSIIPFFLMQNEKAVKATLVKNLWMRKNSDPTITGYDYKCEQYRVLGIPIIPQSQKKTGFEMVKCYYDNYPERVTVRMKLHHNSCRSKRVFDQLFRNKYLVRFKNHYTPVLVMDEVNKPLN